MVKVPPQSLIIAMQRSTFLNQVSSVTRFGEITPLWHNYKRFGQFFEALFSIWHNFDPTLAKIAIGQVFIVIDVLVILK